MNEICTINMYGSSVRIHRGTPENRLGRLQTSSERHVAQNIVLYLHALLQTNQLQPAAILQEDDLQHKREACCLLALQAKWCSCSVPA